ncbi:hypothetical protein CDAR_122761 [Caerostris darwini]|uniref:Profilin n=1 Tax=Caerostris darwini TaxID=1538125 RepID=A0AAV4UYS3_9ARAC|nr:hypothetical protein CDAR_122761 [Caerostris darwini]
MDTQNGRLLNTMASINKPAMPLGDCCQTSLPPELDQMGRGFFADKSLAGHTDKDLKTSARDCRGFIVVGLFSPPKKIFLVVCMEGRKKMAKNSFKRLDALLKSTLKM